MSNPAYSIICCKHNNVGVMNNVELTIGSLDVFIQKICVQRERYTVLDFLFGSPCTTDFLISLFFVNPCQIVSTQISKASRSFKKLFGFIRALLQNHF